MNTVPHFSDAMALPADVERSLADKVKSGRLDLPLLPEVATSVLTLTADESCDSRKLAEILRRDQAMASHILRIANSSLYAPGVPIVSLQQAVSRLGMITIREIALLITCETKVFRVRGFEKEVRDLFRHSLAAGLFAREIARLRRWNVEEAFLSGLLHDVGRPILIQTVIDLLKEHKYSADRETILSCVDRYHAEVGGRVVSGWSLPARLSETILFHHDPTKAPSTGQTAMMTCLADDLSHSIMDLRPMSDADLKAHPMLTSLNVYPDELEQILAQREAIRSSLDSTA